MSKVYIVSARRTAIGSFLGSLSGASPAEMGVPVVQAVLQDAGIKPEQVDELICGNVLSAGLAQGVGRQIAVKSGIPVETCAYSLNMICGSGLKTVMLAAGLIRAGDGDVYVAGGMENMSLAPYLVKGLRGGVRASHRNAQNGVCSEDRLGLGAVEIDESEVNQPLFGCLKPDELRRDHVNDCVDRVQNTFAQVAGLVVVAAFDCLKSPGRRARRDTGTSDDAVVKGNLDFDSRIAA